MKKKFQQNYESEVDLIEIFLVLWEGKWIITLFIISALLLVFAYLQTFKNKLDYGTSNYEISVPISTNNNISPEDKLKQIIFHPNLEDWKFNKNEKKLILVTQKPLNERQYSKMFRDINEEETNKALFLSKRKLNIIDRISQDSLPDSLAYEKFFHMLLVFSVENGDKAYNFGSPKVNQIFKKPTTPPKSSTVIFLAIFIGFLFGSFYLYLKEVLNSYRKRPHKK